jgi:hypothetical protein
MSTSRDTFESIIAVLPDFQPRWQSFQAERQGQETPWYLAMGELAHYIVKSYERGDTTRFEDLFSAVEAVLQNNDTEVQNLVHVGLFKAIQNISSHRTFGATVFLQWLGPRSAVVWNEADIGMQKVAAWASRQKPPWWNFWRRRRSFDPDTALSQVENPELRKIIEQMYRK